MCVQPLATSLYRIRTMQAHESNHQIIYGQLARWYLSTYSLCYVHGLCECARDIRCCRRHRRRLWLSHSLSLCVCVLGKQCLHVRLYANATYKHEQQNNTEEQQQQQKKIHKIKIYIGWLFECNVASTATVSLSLSCPPARTVSRMRSFLDISQF